MCLAVADSPTGPFVDLKAPWFDYNFGAIDAHVFIDQDGLPYLFYEKVGAVGIPSEPDGYLWGRVFAVPLSEDLLHQTAEPKLCLFPDVPWEGPTDSSARSTEGMTVFRIGDVYYMTYSANHYKNPNYAIGYATASHPLGPWKKADNNPILRRDLALGVSGPGHNSIVRSPDDSEWFIVYHTHADPENPSHRRVLNIDRLIIAEDGTLSVIGPTRSPQPVPSR